MIPPTPVQSRGLPYGAETIAAAASDPSGWMILGTSADTAHPEQRLSDLLLGSYAIDAVVPGMIDPLTPGTNRPLRDVIVESSELLAVRAGVVATAAIDPQSDEPGSVIGAVLAHLNRFGRRVVCDPSWMAGENQPDGKDTDRIPIASWS